MQKVDVPVQLLAWKVKLHRLIRDLGLTQQGFANQIGVKRRAVCRWVSLKDASIPHKRHLKLIKQLMVANTKFLRHNPVVIGDFVEGSYVVKVKENYEN